ncbi:MAG: hypothetical protein LBT50_08260 [Prevotellaceae bacterium]|jgi:hypothetical protein|nr:hypothetical protein [Prevotellaceae bacterium]
MKTLKWLIPVICYFIFVGIFYLWDIVDRLIWGYRESDTPVVLPEWTVFILALPLIFSGYIFLPIAQYIYKRSRKWFAIFGLTIIAGFSLLPAIIEYYHIVSLVVIILFPVTLWSPSAICYYAPFFLSLFYILEKEHNQKINLKILCRIKKK